MTSETPLPPDHSAVRWNETTFMVVSEATLPLLGWLLLRGRPAVILETRAVFTPFQGVLDRLSRWLTARGRVRAVGEVFPQLGRDLGVYRYNRNGAYVDCEPWIWKAFDFNRIEAVADAGYVRPIKHEISKFVFEFNPLIYTLNALGRACPPDEPLTVAGLPWIAEELFRVIFGPARHRSLWRRPAVTWLNRPTAWLLGAYGLVEVLAHCRRHQPDPTPYVLGIDWVWGGGEVRHNRVALELVDEGEAVLTVRRNRMDRYDGSMDDHDVVIFGRETCGPRRTLAHVKSEWADIAAILGAFKHLDGPLFLRLASLPIRRIKWRRFVERYPCKLFWGRDDYNVEHYFRTQEMRRQGGISIGLAHGIMGWGILEPQIRHIDFDLYFMFGTGLYDRYHRQCWSPAMRAVAVGSFGMSREQLARLPLARPRDILLFLDPAFDAPDALDLGFEVARAFPDREVLVKIKSSREGSVHYPRMRHMLDNQAPANVRQVTEDSYELMLRASYAISGLSTVAAEAVQFGLATWALDLDPGTKYVYYREFPEFCITTADQVIGRIRAIEAGTARYPRQDYAAMIDLSGDIIYDALRRETGRPARPAPAPKTIERCVDAGP